MPWEVGKYFCSGIAAFWRIFSFDSRTFNKISIAAALRLPISKAVGNYIHLNLKRYRIKIKKDIIMFKIYSEVRTRANVIWSVGSFIED
jgi:hypothetical protein